LLNITRRGKYLLFHFRPGILIIHLGMSGSIRVLDKNSPLQKHDHFELQFNKLSMRLNDPRRFGAVLFSKDGSHPLLNNLGVEPLMPAFDETYLHIHSKNKKQTIKAFIMNNKIVVGVGNIYACEALFKAKIHPSTPVNTIPLKQYQLLTQSIKSILTQAIQQGGTTLQDFSRVDGKPGYFSQSLFVYGRENQPCLHCQGKIARFTQNQRTSFYCPQCQT
jgi:formamidopyrimidine-DNA glycosylase